MTTSDDTHASLLHTIEPVEADLALIASLPQSFDSVEGPPKSIDDTLLQPMFVALTVMQAAYLIGVAVSEMISDRLPKKKVALSSV